MDPLEDLLWHWGMAYRIWTAKGIWYARRNGQDTVMQAEDPDALSFMIRDDYFRRSRPASGSRPGEH